VKKHENLLAGMKMFRETLTFCETSSKILDIHVSAALRDSCEKKTQERKKQEFEGFLQELITLYLGAHFGCVLCVVLHGRDRRRHRNGGKEVLLMIIIASFNCVALLRSTLANVSTPWSRGWGTMAAVVRRQLPWFIVLSQSASMVVVFCVTKVLIPTLRRAVN
jgi:hypothetical protein